MRVILKTIAFVSACASVAALAGRSSVESIRSTVDSVVEVDNLGPHSGLVLLPGHPIYSWSSFSLRSVKAVAEQIDCEIVAQSGESFLLPFLAARRTPLNPWDTRSPLYVGLVWDGTMFSLIRALPSPTSVEHCSPLFGWFVGTAARSDFSETHMSALRLSASRTGLDPGGIDTPRRSPGSRACYFSACLSS